MDKVYCTLHFGCFLPEAVRIEAQQHPPHTSFYASSMSYARKEPFTASMMQRNAISVSCFAPSSPTWLLKAHVGPGQEDVVLNEIRAPLSVCFLPPYYLPQHLEGWETYPAFA